jgi:hypothetical protein
VATCKSSIVGIIESDVAFTSSLMRGNKGWWKTSGTARV